MTNEHHGKYIINLPFGFGFTISGILLIMYASFERASYDNWYFWGILASVLVAAGFYFFLIAIVHKVKSDLIKKQKNRSYQKSSLDDQKVLSKSYDNIKHTTPSNNKLKVTG